MEQGASRIQVPNTNISRATPVLEHVNVVNMQRHKQMGWFVVSFKWWALVHEASHL